MAYRQTVVPEAELLADGGTVVLQLPAGPWMTTSAAAAHLEVAGNRVHGLVQAGTLRSIRLADEQGRGLAMFVHGEDVERWARSRRPRVR